MHHRVQGDGAIERHHLFLVRQFAVEQEVANFKKIGVRRQLVDRVAAVKQDALVSVDEGNVALAAGGRGEARVVGEDVGVSVEPADIDNVGAFGSAERRQLINLVFVSKAGRAGRFNLALSHENGSFIPRRPEACPLSCTAATISRPP